MKPVAVHAAGPEAGFQEPEPEPKTCCHCALRRTRPRRHCGSTVVFFDWDDTILCTSFLNLLGEDEDVQLPASAVRHLQGIQAAAGRLLEAAHQLGHVYIVTNSIVGWVEHSAARWLPELLPLLRRTTVIAARSKEGLNFTGQVATWKTQAFLDTVHRLRPEAVAEVIALGDSLYEMEAARAVGEAYPQALVKTIKFKEAPTAEELFKELEVVIDKFERIVDKTHHLSISLERKWVGDPTRV